jgi:hypothetical protein
MKEQQTTFQRKQLDNGKSADVHYSLVPRHSDRDDSERLTRMGRWIVLGRSERLALVAFRAGLLALERISSIVCQYASRAIRPGFRSARVVKVRFRLMVSR